MRLGDYSTTINNEISVDLIVGNANNVAGGMSEIRFNNSIVRVKRIIVGGIGGAFANNTSNDEGFVRMATARASAIGINEVVFATIVFEGISTGSTTLHLTDARINCINGIMADATVRNGVITVTGVVPPVVPPVSDPGVVPPVVRPPVVRPPVVPPVVPPIVPPVVPPVEEPPVVPPVEEPPVVPPVEEPPVVPPVEEPPVKPEPAPRIPGFGLVATIFGMLGAVLILLKKKN